MSEMAARKLPAIDLDDFERRLRHAPQPAEAAGDPLSELARLVAKDDPFKSMFDDMPSPARGSQPVGAAAAKIPAPPLDLHAAPQDHYVAHKDSAADMTDTYQAPEPVGHEYMRTDGEDQVRSILTGR